MENHYELLGVSPYADGQEIKKAFHILIKKYHPDSAEYKDLPDAGKQFMLIKEAYDILINRESREKYDRHIFKKYPLKDKDNQHADMALKHYRSGRDAYKNNDFPTASREFHSALNLEPDNPLYCSWLGLTFSKIEEKKHDAKKWADKAVKLSPNTADYHINLAIVLKNAGLKVLSEKSLAVARMLDPANRRAELWTDDKSKKNPLRKIFKNISRFWNK